MMDSLVDLKLSKHSATLLEGTSKPYAFFVRQTTENSNKMV